MKSEQLLSLIAGGLAVLFFVLYFSFQVAPQFASYLLLLLLVAFGFILTEQWKTHDAAEFENRFWTALAFCFSTTCLFCKDSPLRFSDERRGMAWSIVCLCTYLCHIYDRDVRRLFLTRVNFIRRQRSADFNAENRAQAKLKVVQLKKITAAIDQRWVSSTFLNLFFLSYVLSAEDQILQVLSEANRDELNLIINDNHFELALILYKVKDHWVCKRFHRTKLLQLLARERINDLNVRSRVVLLDAIQRLGVSAQSSLEEFVRNILLSTKGDELSELKCLMDSKGDIFSMHYLLYVQIRNPSVKQSVLDHIARQARIQSSLMGSMARRRNMLAWRKVLSDIDDTLLSSGGSFPKGVDTSFPKQSIYPGVLAFYRELNLGTSGEDNAEKLRHGDLAFISARPHVYKDVSESATYNKIGKLQKDRGLHTSATLLAGSLDTGSRFLVTKDSEALAQKKFENFKEYLRIYPEYTCVFVGDNGQGDVRAAELVMGDQNIADLLKRTYVHVVQALQDTYILDTSLLRYDNDKNICYFNTYVDAAIDAYETGLIRKTGLQRLMVEAVRDFFMIPDDNWAMMNPEIIRPRSYYVRQATLQAKATMQATATVATEADRLANAAATTVQGTQTTGGRTRSDSFSQAMVSAFSSISGVVTGMKSSNASNTVTVAQDAAVPAKKEPSGAIEPSSADVDKSQILPPVPSVVEASATGGAVTPPAESPTFSSGRKSFPVVPNSPGEKNSNMIGQGIAASKQSMSSNSSTTSSLLSASTSLFRRIPSTHTPAKPPIATSTAIVAPAKVASVKTPPLPTPTLSFSLLDIWEIHRNRPTVYDAPVKSVRKLTGWAKRELRIRELNASIECGNRLLQQKDYRYPGTIDAVDLISYPEVFKTGRTVSTPFGVGTIHSFRASDGMYEILIDQTSLLRSKTYHLSSNTSDAVPPAVVVSQINDKGTISTESAAAIEDTTATTVPPAGPIVSEKSNTNTVAAEDRISVGGSIPVSSTFTIRLFLPGMALAEIRR